MKTAFSLILLLACGLATAEIVEETIDFEYNGAPHKGYLYYDDSHSGKRPGILVVHEWWGLNAYARNRARQIAADGYVAFAMDMYGAGMVTEHPKQAGEWMTQVTSNVADWQKRAQLGVELLRGHEMTDGDKIAAIGYCFGGATVMQLAYGGADVKGVVSLHGSLPPASAEQAKAIQAAILVEHGNDDPFVPEERVREFRAWHWICSGNRIYLQWLRRRAPWLYQPGRRRVRHRGPEIRRSRRPAVNRKYASVFQADLSIGGDCCPVGLPYLDGALSTLHTGSPEDRL